MTSFPILLAAGDVPDPNRDEGTGDSGPRHHRLYPAPGSDASNSPKQRPIVGARGVRMLLIVLAAGFVGFWIARPSVDTTSAEMDVITLSVQGAENVNVEYETQSREHASRYIRDKSGRRVSAPSIAEATLTGVGMTEVRPGIEVPVFMYRERSRDVLVVYAYNYAFLDRHVGAVNLEPSIFHTIADEHNRYVHEMGGEKVVIWRHADDIFVAVTPTNAESLKTRIFSY